MFSSESLVVFLLSRKRPVLWSGKNDCVVLLLLDKTIAADLCRDLLYKYRSDLNIFFVDQIRCYRKKSRQVRVFLTLIFN